MRRYLAAVALLAGLLGPVLLLGKKHQPSARLQRTLLLVAALGRRLSGI